VINSYGPRPPADIDDHDEDIPPLNELDRDCNEDLDDFADDYLDGALDNVYPLPAYLAVFTSAVQQRAYKKVWVLKGLPYGTCEDNTCLNAMIHKFFEYDCPQRYVNIVLNQGRYGHCKYYNRIMESNVNGIRSLYIVVNDRTNKTSMDDNSIYQMIDDGSHYAFTGEYLRDNNRANVRKFHNWYAAIDADLLTGARAMNLEIVCVDCHAAREIKVCNSCINFCIYSIFYFLFASLISLCMLYDLLLPSTYL
jgi:hypothetical protein